MLQAEEQASDVDHFILNEEGDCLQINPRWLQYLQVIHLACHAVTSRRASDVDLFSLHKERHLPSGHPMWLQHLLVKVPPHVYSCALAEQTWRDPA